MKRQTGPPTGVPPRRFAALAAFTWVLAAALLEAAPSPGSPSGAAETGAALDRSLSRIAEAFRGRSAQMIKSVLPAEGKVYLSLGSLGGGTGYFSRDQVYFIFADIFARHETVRFVIRQRRGGEQAKELVFRTGIWGHRGPDGVDEERMLHFFLVLKGESWLLVEIREVR